MDIHMDLVEWGRKALWERWGASQHFIEKSNVIPDKMLKAHKTGYDKGKSTFICDF